MNKQQLEKELKNANYLIDESSEEWLKGEWNDDGDYVVPSEAAARISILIGEG